MRPLNAPIWLNKLQQRSWRQRIGLGVPNDRLSSISAINLAVWVTTFPKTFFLKQPIFYQEPTPRISFKTSIHFKKGAKFINVHAQGKSLRKGTYTYTQVHSLHRQDHTWCIIIHRVHTFTYIHIHTHKHIYTQAQLFCNTYLKSQSYKWRSQDQNLTQLRFHWFFLGSVWKESRPRLS